MNMNADQPDFEPLRRLLKLKRHEQPPPRYFNDFSNQVINRLRAGLPEEGGDALENLALAPAWWTKLVATFQREPMFAGAIATAVCGLLVAGAIYTENMDPGLTQQGSGSLGSQALVGSVPAFGTVSALGLNRTNPASSLNGASIFDVQLPGVQQVAYPARNH